MVSLVIHLLLTTVLLRVVAYAIKGIEVDGWVPAFLGAVVLAIVNNFIRPIALFLTFPLSLVTLGLFIFVVNAVMLWVVAAVVPGMRIKGFGAALLGSLLLTVLNYLIAAVPLPF
jgi:putative membrane protein